MGLFQFHRMPFGLAGAPSSFQRLMDKILRGLPFVTIYLDDVLIHSANEQLHREHLKSVFQRLREAGLTLKGRKCHIGMPKVFYLGHTFSAVGMAPDNQKIQAVQEWPVPTSVQGVHQFLGLASYYRRYIYKFADIAIPLNKLMEKGTSFNLSPDCDRAFNILKDKLVQAPVLVYPHFDPAAGRFVLQTDASAGGLGAVLEQDGHVIAYASRTLTKPERNYSVIQKECLAAVYAMKQFRHYLLGRPFTLITEHAPLQWLSAQKMEGLLSRWALAIQEYDFDIQYRKGALNTNADALSHRDSSISHSAVTTTTQADASREALRKAQQEDPVIRVVYKALSKSTNRPTISNPCWRRPPLQRYRQLWSQLKITDGVVCREYVPGPTSDVINLPVLPLSCHYQALVHNHNSPTAGYQGTDKTLERLWQEAYWVNMATDVERHCRECTTCQRAKRTAPTRAPMKNIPIGRPWQMIAVDILEVPVSSNNNRYLLVVQDYFTK